MSQRASKYGEIPVISLEGDTSEQEAQTNPFEDTAPATNAKLPRDNKEIRERGRKILQFNSSNTGLSLWRSNSESPSTRRRSRSLSRCSSRLSGDDNAIFDALAQDDEEALRSLKNDIRGAIGSKDSAGIWLLPHASGAPVTSSDHRPNDIELGLTSPKSSHIEATHEITPIPTLTGSSFASPSKQSTSFMQKISGKVKGLGHPDRDTFSGDQETPFAQHRLEESIEKPQQDTRLTETYEPFLTKKIRLYGKSLRLFGPLNIYRSRCAKYLVAPLHIQGMKILMISQTVLLAYRQWNPRVLHGYVMFGTNWADWCLFFMNVLYTIEIAMNAIAWGLWDDSQMFSANGFDYKSFYDLSGLDRLKTHFFGERPPLDEPKIERNRKRTLTDISINEPNNNELHRAYLRKSWNRVEFFSSVCFWIGAILSINRVDANGGIPLFRALSCLRILKITTFIPSMALILRSIKMGRLQLTDVLLFLAYFWCFFAIIGVQSFKSSLRRFCVWTNPDDPTDTFVTSQYCGGQLEMIDGTLKSQPYWIGDMPGNRAKGFSCPLNSRCETLKNANGNTFGFDNILTSMQLTFVVMSGNTFSDIMYDVMDAESMAACLFFIAGIFFLLVWLINLLIAVISESFKLVRDKYAPAETQDVVDGDFQLDWKFQNMVGKIYVDLKIFFDSAILTSIVFMSLIDLETTVQEMRRELKVQGICSWILFFEILIRFASYFPNWRIFFTIKRNNLDLLLAIITSVISIPSVSRDLGIMYEWLRFFYLIRIYRLIILVKFTRKLWAKVWKNMIIILNLSAFFFFILFLVSIIFARYFEGFASESDIETMGAFPFHTLPNVFLGLFTVTSTENWTSVMYALEEIAPNKTATFFTVVFFILWFLLSNSVILNVFIAIIADSLSGSESEKRKEQVKKFVLVDFPNRLKALTEDYALIDLRSRLFLKKTNGRDDKDKEIQKLLLNGAAVQAFLKDELDQLEEIQENQSDSDDDDESIHELQSSRISRFFQIQSRRFFKSKIVTGLIGLVLWDSKFKTNPFLKKKNKLWKGLGNENFSSLAERYHFETEKNDQQKMMYLKENPSFNMALYFLQPRQPLRRLCQKITSSSYGRRYDGVEPNKIVNLIFTVLMSIATLMLILVTCYNTPLYQKSESYFEWSWTMSIEFSFGFLFLIEFLIKIIADGFIFTPNGYIKNVWNCIDFIVLISIWVNIIAIVKGDQYLSRIERGIKALRALRLLTITEKSKDIFQKVMIAGFGKILGAAFLSFTLLLPFSVWGLNLFTGRLGLCNDGDLGLDGCINEFTTTVFDWDILAPRSYDQPQLEFNRFASSLLTLFEMISLEGWTDLLAALTSSTGVGTPAEQYASPQNALFLVMFIFIGLIFIMTLFVSVIINNYSSLTGSAFLTLQQTSWMEVKKLLSQINPRTRPLMSNLGRFRTLCFRYTIDRNKYINGTFHAFLWIHILALLLEKYPSTESLDNFRYSIYLLSSAFFLIFTSMKIIAVGPRIFFRIKWNVYEFIVFFGAFSTSLAAVFVSRNTAFANINKLFLVGIYTILVHVSNRLSHLLKIVSASIPSLLSLIFTWGIMFLVFAVAMNQVFGLTRLGPNTTNNVNLRTVPKAMILLFRNSFGEGWNYIMKDFAVSAPLCVDAESFSLTDCGSESYSYILFITWNILSMYIFVNMFISLIFESFSYVYTNNAGTTSLNREEIRKFKTVWQMFDPLGNGYIAPDQLPRFLRSLDGYFAFKVFSGKWTIPELTRKWQTAGSFDSSGPYQITLNLQGLERMLNNLDPAKVQERKFAYERFIEEANFNMELFDEPGISFHRLIVQIPLYARFDESNCLTLTDFLDRLVIARKLNKRIQSRHHLNTLNMIIHRLRFLKLTQPKKISEYRSHMQEDGFNQHIFQTPIFNNSSSFGQRSSDQLYSLSVNNEMMTEDIYWSPSRAGGSFFHEDEDSLPLAEPLTLNDISQSLGNSQWKNELRSTNMEFENFLQASRDIKSRLMRHEKGNANEVDTDEDQHTNDTENPSTLDDGRKLT